LRLLTNLETSERKLLQIVLIGQPKLRSKLQRPELEQLAQRVIARYHLEALTEAETAQYIQHRLEVAGLKSGQPFERRAVQRIHRITHGVPRRINLLCDRALLGAFATGQTTVDTGIVNVAASEVFDPAPRVTPASSGFAWRGLSWAVGGLVAGAALVWMLRLAPTEAPAGKVAAREPASAPSKSPASAPVAVVPPASPASAAASAAGATASAPVAGAPLALKVSGPPTLLRDENQAWQELARLWKVGVRDANPCEAIAKEQLRCFTVRASLALIRQLGRPGIITLDTLSGSQSYALLTALGTDSATLRAGESEQTVTLPALAVRWQGEFSTLWRTPPGYSARSSIEGGPAARWVADALAKADGAPPPAGTSPQNAAFKERLRKFQLVQGLPADGVWGPMTGMQLNRKLGIDEPSLFTRP
jgi:general secretion pathway protein A